MNNERNETTQTGSNNSIGAGKTVLIAEDSAPNRMLLVKILSGLGYTVIECKDGQAALETLKNIYSSGKNVAAVISDINMPNMDGIELLRNIRAHDQLKELPTVLCTAMSDKDTILAAKDLNVNGYLLKPITSQRVVSKMEEIHQVA